MPSGRRRFSSGRTRPGSPARKELEKGKNWKKEGFLQDYSEWAVGKTHLDEELLIYFEQRQRQWRLTSVLLRIRGAGGRFRFYVSRKLAEGVGMGSRPGFRWKLGLGFWKLGMGGESETEVTKTGEGPRDDGALRERERGRAK